MILPEEPNFSIAFFIVGVFFFKIAQKTCLFDSLDSEESCDERLMESGAENCYSVLVETGVYSTDSKHTVTLDHSPRDFLPVQDSYSGMITIIMVFPLFVL